MRKQLLLSLILSTIFTSAFAYRGIKPMSDAEIRTLILEGFLKSYEGECPCPFSKYKQDNREVTCGDQSEYFTTPGKVLCYPRDVADTEVKFYRQKYQIIDPKADPRGQLNFGIEQQNQIENQNANPNYDGSNPSQSPF